MRALILLVFAAMVFVTPVFAEEESTEYASRHEMMMGGEADEMPGMRAGDNDMPMPMGAGMGMCGMMGRKGGGMMGMGPGKMGSGMMGLGMGMAYDSPRYQARVKKFWDETVDLRRELHAKMFDYREALRNEDAKDEEIEKLEEDVYALQEKIREKAPLFMKHRGMMGEMGW